MCGIRVGFLHMDGLGLAYCCIAGAAWFIHSVQASFHEADFFGRLPEGVVRLRLLGLSQD